MSAGMKLRMKSLQIDPIQKIKLKHLINKDGKAQRYFTHLVRKQCDPYVPKAKGPLKNTAVEEAHSITYVQQYASKNYYENSGRGKEGTSNGGKRGKLWDKRMWADHGSEIVDGVASYVGGRSGK